MRIAILSTDKLPAFLGENHPTEDSLFAEDLVLIDELKQLGHFAEKVTWSRQDHAWNQYDLAVIRSTWDYIDHLDSFLSTLKHIESSGVRVINPYDTVMWNHDKRYLSQLSADGLNIVPGRFIDRDQFNAGEVEAYLAEHQSIIIKPVVGVGAFGVEPIHSAADLHKVKPLFETFDTLMMQPFLTSIQSEGEWSFVFGAGRFLYAVLKTPTKGDFRVQVMYGAQTRPMVPSPADLESAKAIYDALPVSANMARIDMARLNDGNLALMEAELIEPQLYFHDVPKAAKLVADSIVSV